MKNFTSNKVAILLLAGLLAMSAVVWAGIFWLALHPSSRIEIGQYESENNRLYKSLLQKDEKKLVKSLTEESVQSHVKAIKEYGSQYEADIAWVMSTYDMSRHQALQLGWVRNHEAVSQIQELLVNRTREKGRNARIALVKRYDSQIPTLFEPELEPELKPELKPEPPSPLMEKIKSACIDYIQRSDNRWEGVILPNGEFTSAIRVFTTVYSDELDKQRFQTQIVIFTFEELGYYLRNRVVNHGGPEALVILAKKGLDLR